MTYEQEMEAFKKRQARSNTKIKVGLVLLEIGSIFFFLNSIFEIVVAVFYPILGMVDWTSPVEIFDYILSYIVLVMLVISGIGGISYAKGKGPFISVVSFMALIVMVLIIVDTISAIIKVSMGNHDWGAFFSDMLSVQFDGTIYLIGWLMSKDDFDMTVLKTMSFTKNRKAKK